jgi:hypothetical protein
MKSPAFYIAFDSKIKRLGINKCPEGSQEEKLKKIETFGANRAIKTRPAPNSKGEVFSPNKGGMIPERGGKSGCLLARQERE